MYFFFIAVDAFLQYNFKHKWRTYGSNIEFTTLLILRVIGVITLGYLAFASQRVYTEDDMSSLFKHTPKPVVSFWLYTIISALYYVLYNMLKPLFEKLYFHTCAKEFALDEILKLKSDYSANTNVYVNTHTFKLLRFHRKYLKKQGIVLVEDPDKKDNIPTLNKRAELISDADDFFNK